MDLERQVRGIPLRDVGDGDKKRLACRGAPARSAPGFPDHAPQPDHRGNGADGGNSRRRSPAVFRKKDDRHDRPRPRPGGTLAYTGQTQQLSEEGPSIEGVARQGMSADAPLVAEIELMFS